MNCCPTPFLYVSWSNFRFPSSIRISPAFKNCCKPLVLRPTLSLASKKGSLFRILSHRFISKAVRWNLEWKALGQGHFISFCVWIKISYCSWDYSIHWSYLVVRSTLCLVSFPNHKFWYSEEYWSGKLPVPSNLLWGNSVSNVSGSYTLSLKPLFLFFFTRRVNGLVNCLFLGSSTLECWCILSLKRTFHLVYQPLVACGCWSLLPHVD